MSDAKRITQILRDCKLFGSVEPRQLADIAEIAQLVNVERGQRLFDQGQPCQGMYIIGDGQVKLFRLNPEGKEHLLHMAGPGATFAEAALFGGFDYPASSESVADCELVFLPKKPFLALLMDHPGISLKLLAGFSVWLRRMVDLMEDIVLRDAAGRLAKYLLSLRADDNAALVQLPMKHQELAAHLGMTRETVSRTLSHLETRRLIALQPRGEVELRDPDGLAELAGE